MEMQNGAALENSFAVSIKLNLHLPYDTAIALLGIYNREMKVMSQKLYTMFRSALFVVAHTCKQLKCLQRGE
jgi:hypothetical protein